MDTDFTVEDIINAYKIGLFPMADREESKKFYWYDPQMRGQLSIEALHIPSRLRRTVLQHPYEIRINTDFTAVIEACAEETEDRRESWLNKKIRSLFIELHEAGHAHSVECWKDKKLVGGLYGLAIGGAFCGESMFSRAKDASKITLVHLCARLWKGGFSILDTQYINNHLLQFGAYEIPRDNYLKKLKNVIHDDTNFDLKAIEETVLVKDYLDMNKIHHNNMKKTLT